MNFLKKIHDKKFDEAVHAQFQKFSKGEFRDRAIMKVKFTANKYTIFTTAEFGNEMVKIVAKKLGNDKTLVKGAIVATSDLTGELEFKDKKQFQGVKRYLIENEMSGTDILNLLEKFPKAFFALTFDAGDSKLKIKPKAPKSGKPSSKGGKKQTPNFCKLITTDAALGQSFVFEKSNFKLAEITHTYFIEEIIKPKGETDFAKIRELAKRKGRVVRNAIIDEQEVNSELEFEA
jgi:hypothetical protein